MKYAPNIHRTALHFGDLPDGPLTDRQRTIADAVRGCTSISDFVAVPTETVTTVAIARIPYGTPDAVVVSEVRAGIARARAELDRLENLLGCYGATAFAPQPEPVDVRPIAGATTKHAIITGLLRHLSNTGRQLIRAGDRRVTLDVSQSCVVEAS